jgi:microcystin-dependent protein
MDPILGSIMLFAGNFAPRGWAQCDGTLIPIQSNTALFSILGTTYGGNGQTTFALPDLRGRAPIHYGQGPGLSQQDLGQVGGAEGATLAAQNVPPLACTVQASATAASKNPAGNVPAFNPDAATFGSPDGTTMAATMVQTSGGGPVPVPTMAPYLAMNYCIALEGIFPSRQ